ncbi:MAG: hypothetical protein JW849_06755 [Phycisphaerae bacterium]|nr:hypothetical protein [Phycisphaerae bacterium]
MTYRTSLLCLALLGFALAGCQAHNDFQKKWPEYPKWGWWKHPAKDVPEPAEDASTEEPLAEEPPSPQTGHTLSDSPAEQPQGPTSLEEHRATVWQEVAVLRDVEELPPAQQRKLVASARGKLRKWYRPMMVEPPDPDDPQWITVLVWDFMPEEDFETAAENWRRTARQENLPFPEEITRRELMTFIGNVTSGELQSPATQPASPPTTPKDKGKTK